MKFYKNENAYYVETKKGIFWIILYGYGAYRLLSDNRNEFECELTPLWMQIHKPDMWVYVKERAEIHEIL